MDGILSDKRNLTDTLRRMASSRISRTKSRIRPLRSVGSRTYCVLVNSDRTRLTTALALVHSRTIRSVVAIALWMFTGSLFNQRRQAWESATRAVKGWLSSWAIETALAAHGING